MEQSLCLGRMLLDFGFRHVKFDSVSDLFCSHLEIGDFEVGEGSGWKPSKDGTRVCRDETRKGVQERGQFR